MLRLPLQNIDPTLLLTAFLPILLFAGAFALEWHAVRRLFWSSLLLAGMLSAACTLSSLYLPQIPYHITPASTFRRWHDVAASLAC